MGSKLDHPGYLGLMRTAILVIAICFVAYMVLRYFPPQIFSEPTITLTPTATLRVVEFTFTPSPTVTLTFTLTPVTPLPDEIEVGKWTVTEICTGSIRTGVQITGALISGGSPPYWIEASYAFIEIGDPPIPRTKAVFAGTTSTYYIVNLEPPLNISSDRYVDVVVSTYKPGEAVDWKSRLIYPKQDCNQTPP